jgi:hypothetical protein
MEDLELVVYIFGVGPLAVMAIVIPYHSREMINDQGTYGLEPGIVVFLINVFLAGVVMFSRLQHTADAHHAAANSQLHLAWAHF